VARLLRWQWVFHIGHRAFRLRLPAWSQAERRRYEQVVSLGRACQPAHQIRRVLGTTSAHVFDWIVTPAPALVALIESDLEGFFARDRLGVGQSGAMTDLPTDTRFVHEFPEGTDVDVQHAQHAGRYAMLTRRWRHLLRSRQHVLFVRQHDWGLEPRAAAAHLQAVLKAKAPRLRFALLYLTGDPADEVPWGQEGIINRYLPQLEPYDWRGDNAAWERLLREALTDPARLAPKAR
jgi:Putative papain-like cysteine peptidase (DUF1796)